MHYLCEKLPWIKISEVYVQAEREVSVPWLWNLVNQESMPLAKDVSKTFTTTIS